MTGTALGDPPRWRFTTDRLRAREMDNFDIGFIATMLGDVRVMHFYPKVLDREESLAWIAKQRQRYRDDGHGLWLLEERATGQPVGQCGVAMQDVNGVREPEVGYLLHADFWKRGFATEAAQAARDWAFAKYPGRRVISLIRPENVASCAVAERNGMTVAGETARVGWRHFVYAVEPPASAAPPGAR